MDWLTLVYFALFGLAVGTYGTVVGAGGGFIIVPVLVLLLKWPHEEAAATSLFVVAANAASGSVSYLRQKRVDLQTGWQFALATLPGAILGPFIANYVSGRLFNLLFGVLLVGVSLYLMFRPEKLGSRAGNLERPKGLAGLGWTVRRITDKRGEVYEFGFSKFWGLALSFVIGFLSTILGIGGGIIHVPAMITFFNFPAHLATATSHFILAISSATGTLNNIAQAHVRFGPAIAMAVGAIVGAQIGGAVSHRIKGRWIVRGLAAAQTIVGIRLILG